MIAALIGVVVRFVLLLPGVRRPGEVAISSHRPRALLAPAPLYLPVTPPCFGRSAQKSRSA